MSDITDRLKELAHAAADQNWGEFSMRVPADHTRDADLVLLAASKEITRLRAELAKADGQINRCVEQNKYLESTISRPQDQIALTPKPFCEEHSKFPYEECPWCEAEAQTALVSRLREYARHDPSCKSWGRIPCPCDCGYDALAKELEVSK